MGLRALNWILLLLLAAAALFVCVSTQVLPDTVASHFGAGGYANGFMSRAGYLRFMLVFVVLLPLGMVLLIDGVLRIRSVPINVPNAGYWLAPERRAYTVTLVRRQMRIFACLLVLFLCYVHWLVVRAHELSPPMLDQRLFTIGIGLFMLGAVSWIVLLRRSFRQPA